MNEQRRFGFRQFSDRNARPRRDNLGNVVGINDRRCRG